MDDSPLFGTCLRAKGCNDDLPWGRECRTFVSKPFRLLCLHRLTFDSPLNSLLMKSLKQRLLKEKVWRLTTEIAKEASSKSYPKTRGWP